MNDTRLVFVLGSGRCGTKAIAKMLTGAPGIEAHHEYCRYAYQREAVLYYMGYLKQCVLEPIFDRIYGSAAYYSEQHVFLDSSHKLVWAVDVLAEMFPDARFVHLVRDGRKVVSSFYYKLQIHDDRAASIMRQWFEHPGRFPMPSPSEKYWWPPVEGDRFERICSYWVTMNELSRGEMFRLEDLTRFPDEVRRLTDFIGVPYSDSYWQFLQMPNHAYVPVNYKLTDEQEATFQRICGPTMERMGYNNEGTYDVKYL